MTRNSPDRFSDQQIEGTRKQTMDFYIGDIVSLDGSFAWCVIGTNVNHGIGDNWYTVVTVGGYREQIVLGDRLTLSERPKASAQPWNERED